MAPSTLLTATSSQLNTIGFGEWRPLVLGANHFHITRKQQTSDNHNLLGRIFGINMQTKQNRFNTLSKLLCINR